MVFITQCCKRNIISLLISQSVRQTRYKQKQNLWKLDRKKSPFFLAAFYFILAYHYHRPLNIFEKKTTFYFKWLIFPTLLTDLIGHYNTLVEITTQHLTPPMLCKLILYRNGGIYSLMSIRTTDFLETFHSNFISSSKFLPVNGLLQPLRQDSSLISHTTHFVCVNFTHEHWHSQFKVNYERKAFLAIFILLLKKKLFFFILFGIWTRVSHLIKQHTTY